MNFSWTFNPQCGSEENAVIFFIFVATYADKINFSVDMPYPTHKPPVCKISVFFILKIPKTIDVKKILFVVDRKLMKSNLDILMP